MALFKKPDALPLSPRSLAAKAAGRGAADVGTATRAALLAARSANAWSPAEMRRCRAVRACVPVVDAAVSRLVRLCGGFAPRTGDDSLDRELSAWARRVSVGHGGVGLDAFLDAYLDSLLVCGRAVGEIVTDEHGRGVAAVLCADPALVEPSDPADPLAFSLRGVGRGGRRYTLEQDSLLFTPLSPEPESPYGVSLLRGLEGVAAKLLLIFESVGACWERFGSPRYAVTVKDGGDELFADETKLDEIAAEWRRVMSGTAGDVYDFVASGDVDVRVIGGESEALDPTAAARLLLEQIVAKLGLPPFLLGMSWSTTERMSAQQADLLTSEIDAIRRAVTPALAKIFETQLALSGRLTPVEIEWATVSLQDEVELARAELYRAQAAAERAAIE